ncbi:MAG: putative Fe-S protein YdhL (DUF1289 family) [Oleiphilaceae bacterium]|jgi:predicted Fe-S protein YdhL (DUF1289 family)
MNNTISPCIRNCCLNEQDICLGCFRSLDEIRQWNASTEALKAQVLCLAKARKSAHKLKFGLRDG